MRYFLLLLLTIILMYILPYQYGVEDQAIYLPLIKKSLNQTLYQGDYLLKYHSQTTVFFPIVKFIYPFFGDLERLFSLLYFMSLFFILLGIYKVSRAIFQSKPVSLIALLIFILPKWIGGTGVLTYENYFLPRLLATPFLLFALYYLIYQKIKTSALLSSFTFIIHPVSAIPLAIIFFVYLFLKRKAINKKDIAFSFLTIFVSILIVISLAQKEFSQTAKFLVMPHDWLHLVKIRDSFIFPQLWKLRSFGSLVLFYLFYFIFLIQTRILRNGKADLNKNKETIINLSVIISLSIPLLFIVISELIPITFILQLEPARSLAVFAYLSIICFAYASYQIIRARNPFLLKFFISVFLFFSIFLWNNKHPEKIDQDFLDVQIWARNNTDINSIFLTPPTKKGFRIYSERAIIGEYKDGGPILFSYDLAKEWEKRMKGLQSYLFFTEKDINRLKNKYHFDYIVVEKPKNFDFIKLHENNKYIIYKPTYY